MKLILLFVIFMWGTNFVIIKFLIDYLSMWSLLFFRSFFAVVGLVLFLRKSLHIRPSSKKVWGYVLSASILGILVNGLFIQWGLQYTLATNAALIMGLTPLATALTSYIAFHNPLHWKQLVGIGLGFTGVLLVVLKGSLKNLLELTLNLGDLIIVGALIAFSLSFIFIKKASDEQFPPELISLYANAITAICIFPMVFWEQSGVGWNGFSISPLFWVLLLYIGIFANGVGNSLWNRGIGVLGPSRCAVFMNGVPLVAAITSVFVLGEPILWMQIIGFLFIATGVFFGSQITGANIKRKNPCEVKEISGEA